MPATEPGPPAKTSAGRRAAGPASLLAPLLAALLAAETLIALGRYQVMLPHMDQYQFLEAARAIEQGGTSRIAYWPASSAGMDLLHWSHHLPPFLYAAVDAVVGLELQDLFLVNLAETLLMTLAVVAVLARALPTAAAAGLTALAFLDPVFHREFVAGTYSKWPVIFGFGALLALDHARAAAGAVARRRWLALAGLAAALAPLSFVSVGLPIAVALAGLIALGPFSHRDRAVAAAAAILPVVAFALNFVFRAGTGEVAALGAAFTGYGGEVLAPGLGPTAAGRAIGRELVRLVVPPGGPSSLPLGLAALAAATAGRLRLGPPDERPAVRTADGLALAWLALLVLVPSHATAARMTWMLPLLLVELIRGAQRRGGAVVTLTLAVLLALAAPTAWREGRKLGPASAHIAGLGRQAPAARRLAAAVRAVADGEVRPGTAVLSNDPFGEMFPPGTRRLDLYTYRGLFGGATTRPADRVFLLGVAGAPDLARYPGLGPGKLFRYRQWVYRLERQLPLGDGVILSIGHAVPSPASGDSEVVIERAGDVAAEAAERYLVERAGLPYHGPGGRR